MKYVIVLMFLILSSNLKSDTTKILNKKFLIKKNLLEYSFNCLNLLDGQGFKFVEPWLNFAYTRKIFKNQFVDIEYFSYSQSNKINDSKSLNELKRGDVYYTTFDFVKFGYGRFFNLKKMFISPNLNLNYRWGKGEKYYWDSRNSILGEPVFNRNAINSFGLGVGSNIGYNINNFIKISINCNLAYNFEKYKFIEGGGIPKEDSDAFNFKPNRKFSTIQLRLGYKF